MIPAIISLYSWRYPSALVFMMQSCGYRVGSYLAWYWRTQDFSKVEREQKLNRTKRARIMLTALRVGMLAQIAAGLVLLGLWKFDALAGGWQFGAALILSYPIVWAHLAVVPLVVGRKFGAKPKQLPAKQAEEVGTSSKDAAAAAVANPNKSSTKKTPLKPRAETKRAVAKATKSTKATKKKRQTRTKQKSK